MAQLQKLISLFPIPKGGESFGCIILLTENPRWDKRFIYLLACLLVSLSIVQIYIPPSLPSGLRVDHKTPRALTHFSPEMLLSPIHHRLPDRFVVVKFLSW